MTVRADAHSALTRRRLVRRGGWCLAGVSAGPMALVVLSSPYRRAAADEVVARRMLAAVNGRRLSHGASPVSLDIRLTRAAQAHVDDMVVNDFVSHTGSDGGTVLTRCHREGYAGIAFGENLQAGLPTVAEAVAAWMASPGHRANMLRAAFRHVGVGYRFAPDDDGRAAHGHYWATVFATPDR